MVRKAKGTSGDDGDWGGVSDWAGSGDGGKGGGKGSAGAWGWAAPARTQLFYRLNVEKRGSQLVERGFPVEAPAVFHDRDVGVFSDANSVMSELIDDSKVEFIDDPDWTRLPEVAFALGKTAGGEPESIMIALCPSKAKWAVGMAAGAQGRSRASKLALAIAIAEADNKLKPMFKKYPAFRTFCINAGVWSQEKEWQDWDKWEGQWDGETNEPAAETKAVLPDAHRVVISGPSSITAQGLPPEAPALVWDKSANEFFKTGPWLCRLLEVARGDLAIYHDTDGTQFPEVAAALEKAGVEREGFCVMAHAGFGVWGVGVAGSWKNREVVAKVSLALAAAPAKGKLQEVVASNPDFGIVAQKLAEQDFGRLMVQGMNPTAAWGQPALEPSWNDPPAWKKARIQPQYQWQV